MFERGTRRICNFILLGSSSPMRRQRPSFATSLVGANRTVEQQLRSQCDNNQGSTRDHQTISTCERSRSLLKQGTSIRDLQCKPAQPQYPTVWSTLCLSFSRTLRTARTYSSLNFSLTSPGFFSEVASTTTTTTTMVRVSQVRAALDDLRSISEHLIPSMILIYLLQLLSMWRARARDQ